MSQKKSSGSAVFVMTRCGILAAMAVILYYIEIPVVAFYKLDLSTLPAILAGFAMGPLPGVAVVVIKNMVREKNLMLQIDAALVVVPLVLRLLLIK